MNVPPVTFSPETGWPLLKSTHLPVNVSQPTFVSKPIDLIQEATPASCRSSVSSFDARETVNNVPWHDLYVLMYETVTSVPFDGSPPSPGVFPG